MGEIERNGFRAKDGKTIVLESNVAVGLLPILPLENGGSLRPLWTVVGLLWLLFGLVLWFEQRVFFLKSERISR